jgi:hypothetical protein
MVSWESRPLGLSGAELDVQEALTALRRLLDAKVLRSTTRVIVEGAVLALTNELGD